MCGIAGALSHDGRYHVTPHALATMRDTMVHRGPDGADLWCSDDGRVGFAHRRLAIIDLSTAASQPMSTPNGRYWITFNGEIYNHAALRQELRAEGVDDWTTDHSDTEVLLRVFARWGIDGVHRLHGMFAFAVWDASENALWLVRDRIGVKPLYYVQSSERTLFASEIKALLTDPTVPRRLDEESLFHYLSFLTVPAPRTLFAGVRKLSPGTWMRVGPDGSTTTRRYWDVLDEVEPLVGASDTDVAERVLESLREAVALRKVADVPIGIFLSGGVDSSTNAALFAEGETRPVRTFSIGYEGEHESYKNELHFARSMANRVGAEHHERLLTIDDLLDFLPKMVELQDEPIGDPVCVPVYYVAKLARDNGVTVCQVGEGADELFCGYPFWQTMISLQQTADRYGRYVPKSAALSVFGALGKSSTFKYEYLRRSAEGQQVFWSGAEAFTDRQKRGLLSAEVVRGLGDLTSWDAISETRARFDAKAWDHHPLNWMTYADLNLRLPELLLMRVDKMTMGVSLEARVPFLDHRFVSLAMSIPAEQKVRGGVTKRLLKQAVRGVIPDELIDRPKQGFGVPVYEYVFDRLGDVARSEIRTFARETGLLDGPGVERLLGSGEGPQIWYLLNVALWWKSYIR